MASILFGVISIMTLGSECGVPVFYQFHIPNNGNKIWWYSFHYGLVHLTMISTENNFIYGSQQYQ